MSQELLFSESSIAETGVWCTLSEGIDPSKWASLCRCIGNLETSEFERVSAMLQPEPKRKAKGIIANLKGFIKSKVEDAASQPLVSIGPGKPGDMYQWEITLWRR